MTTTTTTIGNLGSRWRATVDERGRITSGGMVLDWWIGAEDRWHFASTEPDARVRQRLIDATPVVETAIRVPGGEAIQRAYAVVVGGEDLAVMEVENASHVPFGVAFALSGDEVELRLQKRPASTDAPDGAPDVDSVVVYPLPHTARVRVALPLGGGPHRLLPHHVPSPETVASGWVAHRKSGMRVVVPDERLQEQIDADLCARLLAADAEARGWPAALWRRLSGRFVSRDETNPPENLVQRLLAVHRQGIALLPVLPDEWLGQGVEVHDAPTRHGVLSYAVRWHGARPAILWEVSGTGPVTITAPALDPSWSTSERAGDALLSPVAPPGGLPKVYGVTAPAGTPAPEVGESFQ